MPLLDATQLLDRIKALADEAAAAATATVKVDFGTGVQPQNRVLNAWQTLGFKGPVMQVMHAMDSVGIYVIASREQEEGAG